MSASSPSSSSLPSAAPAPSISEIKRNLSAALSTRKYAYAKEAATVLLSIEPTYTEAHAALGAVARSLNNFSSAASHYQNAVKFSPSNMDLLMSLADALRLDGKPVEAVPYLERAAALIQPSIQAHRLMAIDLQVHFAKCLWDTGDQPSSVNLLLKIISKHEKHVDALIQYAKALRIHAGDKDALRALLRVLSVSQTDTEMKSMLADILKNGQESVELLKSELPPTQEVAPAYAMIAHILRDEGKIDSTVALLQFALELQPSNAGLALSLVHALEIKADYNQCIQVIRDFCSRNMSLSVLPSSELGCASVLEHLPLSISSASSSSSPPFPPAHITGSTKWNLSMEELPCISVPDTDVPVCPLPSKELDLLALFETAAKILFITGHTAELSPLLKLIESARSTIPSIYKSHIRNENAYFCTILQLFSFQSEEQASPASERPLYVCGDSHCMSSAWQSISVDGESRILVPKLVTGIKSWHLRPDSVFYPKYHFQHVVDTIPNESEVIFNIGEIDCREGIVLAVERARYPTVQAGIETVIDIYMNVLRELRIRKQLTIYVHPALPVLHETRRIVLPFNRTLESRTMECIDKGRDLPGRLVWLPISSHDILECASATAPDGDLVSANVRPEFVLDGTHLNSRYVGLIQRALNKK